MLGSALYYPYIDIEDGGWLRSAVLFWDDIQTIVPTTIEKPYTHRDTKICEQEGYLRPLRVDLHPDLLQTLGKQIISLMEEPGWLADLFDSAPRRRNASIEPLRKSSELGHSVRNKFVSAGARPEKLSPEIREVLLRRGLARVHGAKFPPELRRMLRESDMSPINVNKIWGDLQPLLGAEPEGDWLLVNSQFADMYMAVLAGMLAQKNEISPLTNEQASLGLNLRQVIDQANAEGSHRTRGAVVSVVMKGLRVDPDVPIQKLLAFRRSRSDQLAELSATFDDLTSKIEKSGSKRELKDKASRVYKNNILPGLKNLKDELSDESIKSVWQSFFQAATVSVGAQAALTALAASTSTILGVGAFLAVATVGVNTIFAKRKARRASPYTYLLDVERKFSMPRYSKA